LGDALGDAAGDALKYRGNLVNVQSRCCRGGRHEQSLYESTASHL
jgi:hypothetical protein